MDKLLCSGDTLFAGGIGRTDLPGGNTQKIISSLKNILMVLPDDTRVITGHGEETTIGKEKRTNPYI
jgi:glyoxylase-like metal-dependent hydrolase (beta-lactamase superfamily II)